MVENGREVGGEEFLTNEKELQFNVGKEASEGS